MAKITVPKELQDKIIDLYENKKYGRTRIVKELSLPFGEEKVKNILKENNVYIRNAAEARAVGNRLKPDLRKFSINDNYNFESHNGAWLLGMYAADGYLPSTRGAQNRVILSLQKKDKDLLETIKNELQYAGEIHEYLSTNGHPYVSLAFTSEKIRKTMESYGIVSNKTFKLERIPDLPFEYKIDFIRGFFDGDGSLYELKKEKRVRMNIVCASRSLLEDINIFLSENYSVTLRNIHVDERHKHNAYYMTYNKKDSFTLGKIFYDNDYISLPRKKKRYFEYLEKYSQKDKYPTRLNTPKG